MKIPHQGTSQKGMRKSGGVLRQNKLTALGSKGAPICSIYGLKPPIKTNQNQNSTKGKKKSDQALPDIKELNRILSQQKKEYIEIQSLKNM